MALKAYGKRAIQAFVDEGKEFTHETIKGAKFARWDEVPLGRLADHWPPNYDEVWRAKPVSVIFSYKTPIAWRFDGEKDWTVPEIHYSVTTTNHQNVVRVAADNKGHYGSAKW